MARILLVDPNGLTAEHATQVLMAAGHSCGWVTSAEEAMRVIEHHRPDVLLLEDMLPGESGTGLLRSLKQSHRFHDLPVIMLTTTQDIGEEKAAFQFGAQDYIRKPFDPSMLQFRVRQVLDARPGDGRARSAETGLNTQQA